MDTKVLEILYMDDDVVAINKPPGLLVHRTRMANDATEFAMQILRNQLGRHVFTLHRLDRKTSGILIFGLRREVAQAFQEIFVHHDIQKDYVALVRGHVDGPISCERTLKDDQGHLKDACTHITPISTSTIDLPTSRYTQSRYSLVSARPTTGRFHQIRRHLSGLNHPVLGDRPHGCSEQNRLLLDRFDLKQMMLHAKSVTFTQPFTQEEVSIKADCFPEMKRMMKELGFGHIPSLVSSSQARINSD